MTAEERWRAERDAHGEKVTLTIETRVPSKWLLFDRETGNAWEHRDGRWRRPEPLDLREPREVAPGELAEALVSSPGADVVSVEVRAADGTVLKRDLMHLAVVPGADMDPTGVYTWVTLVAQAES